MSVFHHGYQGRYADSSMPTASVTCYDLGKPNYTSLIVNYAAYATYKAIMERNSNLTIHVRQLKGSGFDGVDGSGFKSLLKTGLRHAIPVIRKAIPAIKRRYGNDIGDIAEGGLNAGERWARGRGYKKARTGSGLNFSGGSGLNFK